eukprot:gene20575-31687_t
MRTGLVMVGAFVSVGGAKFVLASETTCLSVFKQYASLEKEGEKMMSVEDFIRSLLRRRVLATVSANATKDVEQLFRQVDANSDGLLSFQEYSLFMTLLTNRKEDIEWCFRMFDFNKSLKVEIDEFKAIVTALSNDPTVKYSWEGGLTEKFFRHKSSLTFKEFYGFVAELKEQVMRSEFYAYNASDVGTFDSVVKIWLGGEIPEALSHNVARIQEKDRQGSTFGLRNWMTLRELFLSAEVLGEAFEIYKKAGHSIMKPDFIRAVRAAAPDLNLTRKDVESIFLIFGNEDGSLNDKLCLQAMKEKRSWGLRTLDRGQPRRNFAQSLLHCLSTGNS